MKRMTPLGIMTKVFKYVKADLADNRVVLRMLAYDVETNTGDIFVEIFNSQGLNEALAQYSGKYKVYMIKEARCGEQCLAKITKLLDKNKYKYNICEELN